MNIHGKTITKMLSKIFTTVKYTLVTVTFLFLITGIIILSVGSSVQSAYNGYHVFLSERFFSLPSFCIATGIIIFLISFFGFYGAYMENYYMNMVFVGAMVLIFIFQLSACIAGYALRGNTVALIQTQLRRTMQLYGTGPQSSFEVTKLWDEVQEDFRCCGVVNSSDWLQFQSPEVQQAQGLPVSCCAHFYGVVHTFTCNVTIAYTTSCSDAFGLWVQSHAAVIGGVGIFLVIAQALAVAGAIWMAKMSKEEQPFN